MALIKKKEINKMNKKDREDKLKDLKWELIRANVTANKANAKTKEIKRTIARLNTINKILEKKPEKELKSK